MQELTFVAENTIELRDRPAPVLDGGAAALVRPLAVARCDLDLAIARGVAPVPGPFPVGHECVAEVIETGDAVSSVKKGDRVIVPFQISCGACDKCRRGHTGSCKAVPKGAAYGLGMLGGGSLYGGAVADVLRVPFADAMLVKLPPELEPVSAAALGDNAIDGFRTVSEPLARDPGARVLVGRIDARRDLPAAASLAAKGAFDLATVATTVVDWPDAARAWTEPSTKLVVRRN
jgi:alcohol dehydrogenase